MHVTVIDGTGAPPRSDMTVLIVGYRIAEIAKSNTISVPRFARTIDATGSFLIPGLWDMHAHPDDPELWPVNPPPQEKEKLLTLLIANGVTGIRDMGGDLRLLQAVAGARRQRHDSRAPHLRLRAATGWTEANVAGLGCNFNRGAGPAGGAHLKSSAPIL